MTPSCRQSVQSAHDLRAAHAAARARASQAGCTTDLLPSSRCSKIFLYPSLPCPFLHSKVAGFCLPFGHSEQAGCDLEANRTLHRVQSLVHSLPQGSTRGPHRAVEALPLDGGCRDRGAGWHDAAVSRGSPPARLRHRSLQSVRSRSGCGWLHVHRRHRPPPYLRAQGRRALCPGRLGRAWVLGRPWTGGDVRAPLRPHHQS